MHLSMNNMKLFHKKQTDTPPLHKNALSLRIIMMLFTGLLLIAVGYTIFFIYTNVYNTIGEVRSLILNAQNFGVEVIDFQRFEKVSHLWEQKQMTTTTSPVRDPFYAPPAPPPPAVTEPQ